MNTILFVGEHPKTFDVRWHSHQHWELVYCTSGEGAFRFENGTVLHYSEGDVVAIPPQEIHSNSSTEGFSNIHITMEEPSFPYHSTFRIQDEDGGIRMAFSQAKTYYMSDVKQREMILTAIGDLIVAYIVVQRSNSEFSAPVERIRTTIIRNFSRSDFALDEFIRQMPFHYDYLRKLFKKETGLSPLEYLTRLRMRSAEKLLTAMWTNEYSVSEIARMCGYDDALYFSRVFKKYYGCAPSNFNKQSGTISKTDPGRRELEENQP